MQNHFRSLVALLALSLAAMQPMAAQTITGSMVGSVTDSSGLPIAGVEATATNLATGAARTARSNERGDILLGSLQPGEYTLTLTAKGFKTLQKQNIALSATDTLSLGKFTMEIGAIAETVTVSAQGATVQIASGEHADLISSDQLDGLMTKSRNVMSLLSLMPGIYDAGSIGNQDFMDRNFELYVQGNRRSTSSVSLDGMTTNPMGNNFNNVVTVSQDSIAEVKVLLSNYAAEYGRSSGASINVITKSGTKSFHGLGSYFKRHEEFNATNYFSNLNKLAKPRYRYNTWSYNVGGPVILPGFNKKRDKLFFFWSQEYWPLKGSSAVTRLTVPTALERTGNFTQSVDLNNRLVTVNDPATRQPFPNRTVPASQIDKSGLALLNVFPLPNFTDRSVSNGNYNYVFQADKQTPVRMENLRTDYIINSRNSMSFTFAGFLDRQNGGLGIATTAANWEQMVKNYSLHGQGYILRYTGVFSPTLINETSLGFTRRPEGATASDAEIARNQRANIGYTATQFNPASNPLGLIPNATFGGVTSAANLSLEGRFPFYQRLQAFNLTNNTTKIYGAHTLKAGIMIERNYEGANNNGNYAGSISFATDVNNPLNTGYAYANAAVGVFNTYTEASNRVDLRFRQHGVDWFVQDSWKATRRLTLELGVRFHYIVPIYGSTNQLSSFAPDVFSAAKTPKLIQPVLVNGVRMGVNPATGVNYPAVMIGAIAPGTGDPANGMAVGGHNGYPRSLIDTYSLRMGPRAGFALDVFGNGKTAIRGGFGMFYNRPNMSDNLLLFASQAPVVNNPTVYYSTLNSLLTSGGAIFPQSVNGLDRSDSVPHIMNFSFSIQQAIGRNVVEAGYVGSLGRNLLWRRNINSIPVGTNFLPSSIDPTTKNVYSTSFLRPIVGYNDILMSEAASSSNYNSAHVTARRRLTKGLQFGLSWTWSKAMDYNDNDADSISSLVSPRVWNYSVANFDRTHLFKFNWVWNLPKTPFKAVVLKQAFNGWQLSGIASLLSGAPLGVGFTSATGADFTGTATQGARVVVLSNPVLPKGDRDFFHNFRTDVFAPPTIGTWGNSARNIVRGPGVNNFDLSLNKEFPIRDQMRFQFRAEAYNAFNHTQFSTIDTTARFDATGKQINSLLSSFTGARSARIMQFALRFYF
jgi:hypothetical protein